MHVMTKYIDTYKAAIAALEDYCAMQQIIDTTDQQIKDAYNAVTSVSSARLDGMPHAPNPRGGEDRIAATLDKVDAYRARYARRASTWTGSCPHGASCPRTTGGYSTRSSSPPTTLAKKSGYGLLRTTSMSSARLLIQKRAGLCGVLPVLCLASGS